MHPIERKRKRKIKAPFVHTNKKEINSRERDRVTYKPD